MGSFRSNMLPCHPVIVDELALSNLHNRMITLGFLAVQREVIVAVHDEVTAMIGKHQVYSMGIGATACLVSTTRLGCRLTSMRASGRLCRKAAERQAGGFQWVCAQLVGREERRFR